jgi:hypothetical protein
VGDTFAFEAWPPPQGDDVMGADLASLTVDGGGIDLAQKIGWEDDLDTTNDHDPPETEKVGSKTSLAKASAQIVDAIRERRSQI